MQFSRDPMNLVNKHSRKYEGFVNDKAIGINADSNTVCNTFLAIPSLHTSSPRRPPPGYP